MKKKYVMFFLMVLCSINSTFAAAKTAVASGNWNAGSTWDGGTVPADTDTVTIGNFTVTVTANAFCATLTTNPGAAGATNLVINSGIKLTISGIFNVQASDATNDTYVSGTGSIQAGTLNIGQVAFNPTTSGITNTTLYVDQLTEFKITGNMVISSRIDIVAPTKINAGRLRHRSGVIDLRGTMTAPYTRGSNTTQSTGLSDLGYRTDNTNQGDSKIIFRNNNPTIPASGDSTSNLTGGTVEFNMTTGTYTLPGLSYKILILNSSGRSFSSTNATTKIIDNGKLYLLNGTLSSTSAFLTLGLDNNVEIVRTNGAINNNTTSRLRLISSGNQYNVTYTENASAITSGRELFCVYNSAPVNPSTVTVSTTNGVLFNDAVQVTTMNISTASTATAIGGDLQVSNFTVNASNTIALSGSLEVDNLAINANSSFTGSGSIKTSNVLSVTNGATLTLVDNMLTLLSNSTNTARVAPLLNNETITGTVNVQRYLPNNKRQWRLLTAPVTGATDNSVYYNWQLNGVSTYVGGTDIWGPDGSLVFEPNDQSISNAGNGLVLITDSLYNLRKWDNTSGAFSNVTNTIDEPLFDTTKNFGFLSFFTHPFLQATPGDGTYNGTFSALNLSVRGSLITGDVTYNNITNTKYYMIGNPYASALNFGTMLADAANQGVKKIWVIDPTVGQFGSYVTYDAVAGVYNNSGSSFNGSTVLQSGQAFFVLAAGYGKLYTTSLIIKESHKSTVTTNATFNKVAQGKVVSNKSLFRVLLEKENSGNFFNLDGAVAVFYDGGSNAVEGNDAYKLNNPNENISLYTATTSLSIEHRATVQDNDFLTIRVSQAVVGTNYKLKLFTENFNYQGIASLEDSFLGTSTPIALDGSMFEYVYQVTADAKSINNRFKVIFKQQGTLANPIFKDLTFNVYPNPLSNTDSIKVQISTNGVSDSFDYKISSLQGQEVAQGKLNFNNSVGTVALDGRLSAGVYILQVRNTETNEKISKKIIIK